MPALTACYFCGDAVGASLEEHAIPPDAPADDQVSVTLCADCHGKLAALLEELPVGGPDDGSGTDSTPTGSSEPTSWSASAPGDEAADDGDSEPVAHEDLDTADAGEAAEADTVSMPGSETDVASTTDVDPETSPDPASEPDVDPLAGDQEPIFADEDGTLLGEDELPDEQDGSRPFASDAGEDADASSATAESSGAAEATDGSDPIAAPPAEDATDPGADAESAAGDHDATDDDPVVSSVEVRAGSGGGSTQRTGSDAASDDSTNRGATDGPLADVSPRTYNRVVRLLQNREFPVDRHDFEALATSAYELDHGECAAALDGAIEKGLLEERGGELHRPE